MHVIYDSIAPYVSLMPEAKHVDPYLYGLVGSIFLCVY